MIINSLLDTDFYKLSMCQLAFHFQPERIKMAEYSMKCRNDINLLSFKTEIEKEINHWRKLTFKQDEIEYLRNLKLDGFLVFKEDFLEFLTNLTLDSLEIQLIEENGQLNIRVKGDWKYSIFAEIPILAIVQEVYWKNTLSETEYSLRESMFMDRLFQKDKFVKQTKIKFADFGTRRRFSYKMHEKVIEKFKDCTNCIGTSNVLFAKIYNMKPVGSNSHEFFQSFQILGTSFETSQSEAIQEWAKEYPNNLKVILTDILGIEMFFKDCSKEMAEHYSTFRQDSGVPKEIGYKIINWLESLGIDPKTKSVLFSDDLNFEKDDVLNNEFEGKLSSTPFGNGTYLTNDMGLKPVSLVMKMVRMNGQHVIKLSDSEGKIMCEDQETIKRTQEYIKNRLGKS